MTRVEELQLLDALAPRGRKNIQTVLVVRLALETAMRRSELLAVRWKYVDLEARTIQVPVTKNGQPRTVPLSTGAVQALREVPRADSPEVFSITWMALHRAFRVGCRAAGIEDLRFHDLRHTATSRMAGRLPNLIELSAVTGHKTMQMLKRYYHPNASELALKLG